MLSVNASAFMGLPFQVRGCVDFHRTGLGRPAIFPTKLARLCWPGFARLSSLAMCAGRAGGFFFSRVEAGGVVRFHASSLFFCLFAVITNAAELFATVRKEAAWTR